MLSDASLNTSLKNLRSPDTQRRLIVGLLLRIRALDEGELTGLPPPERWFDKSTPALWFYVQRLSRCL